MLSHVTGAEGTMHMAIDESWKNSAPSYVEQFRVTRDANGRFRTDGCDSTVLPDHNRPTRDGISSKPVDKVTADDCCTHLFPSYRLKRAGGVDIQTLNGTTDH